MKKSVKKLHLHRETLLTLNDSLRKAVGGASAISNCCTDPTICATNCTSCNLTDTCPNAC